MPDFDRQADAKARLIAQLRGADGLAAEPVCDAAWGRSGKVRCDRPAHDLGRGIAPMLEDWHTGLDSMGRRQRWAPVAEAARASVTEDRSAPDRFLAKLIQAPSGHWIWTGARTVGGYGCFQYMGRQDMAHRVAHRLFKGPIPIGYQIDHLCRMRICVNPLHLQAVVPLVNIRRAGAIEAAATRRRNRTECVRGHALDAINTYTDSRGRRGCVTCRRARTREHQMRRTAMGK